MNKNIATFILLLSFLKMNAQSCPDNNHPHAIDLGIGLKWACCNVGASSPEKKGSYFAWGETRNKKTYNEYSYDYYNSTTGHQAIASDISNTDYDVVHVKWGGEWKMPNIEQFRCLLQKCTIEDYKINGVWGSLITGPNGISIFLPDTGYKYANDTIFCNRGYYWSSIMPKINQGNGVFLVSNGSGSFVGNDLMRSCGMQIRPVGEECEEFIYKENYCPDDRHPHLIDLALPSGTKWSCCDVGASSPFEKGELFSWGETKSKSQFSPSTYSLTSMIGNDIDKYGTRYKDISFTEYDVAHVQWDSQWRMPTIFDYEELYKYTRKEIVNNHNKEGVKFVGTNGKTIFIFNKLLYWTSLKKTTSNDPISVLIKLDNCLENSSIKWRGAQVRPVQYGF